MIGTEPCPTNQETAFVGNYRRGRSQREEPDIFYQTDSPYKGRKNGNGPGSYLMQYDLEQGLGFGGICEELLSPSLKAPSTLAARLPLQVEKTCWSWQKWHDLVT